MTVPSRQQHDDYAVLRLVRPEAHRDQQVKSRGTGGPEAVSRPAARPAAESRGDPGMALQLEANLAAPYRAAPPWKETIRVSVPSDEGWGVRSWSGPGLGTWPLSTRNEVRPSRV